MAGRRSPCDQSHGVYRSDTISSFHGFSVIMPSHDMIEHPKRLIVRARRTLQSCELWMVLTVNVTCANGKSVPLYNGCDVPFMTMIP